MSNPGLCAGDDPDRARGAARRAEGVIFEPLDRLPLMSGIELLRDLGVEPNCRQPNICSRNSRRFNRCVPPYSPPAAYSPPTADAQPVMPAEDRGKELIEAVEELKGHALALNLVGESLAEEHHGDIRAIHDLPPARRPRSGAPHPQPLSRNARHRDRACPAHRGAGGRSAKPAETVAGRQLALLFFLGFFDRPAEPRCFPSSSRKPPRTTCSRTAADLKLAATDLSAQDAA